MYHDYRSKSLTQLTNQFLDLLSRNLPENPFQKNWIIVQNREMEQWLSLNMAKRNKISANNEFILPSEFIWKLYRTKDSDLDTNLPSDIIPLQWSVFELIQIDTKLHNILFRGKESNSKIILQLSRSIADVFDLYQVFRPEMLKKWESDNFTYKDNHEYWQASLWNKLNKKWNKKESVSTRVEAFDQLKNWIKKDDFPVNKIPESIWVFNIPQASEPFSEIIALVSNKIECHNFDFVLEHQDQGQDSDVALFSKKLLSASLNKESVLKKSFQKHHTEIKTVLDSTLSHPKESKLAQTQNLLSGKAVSDKVISDQSITIHSCHSKKREVEVLKDSILDAMNFNKELKPEDVLILVPHVNEYRSQLRDVFTSEADEISIPINLGFLDYTEFRESTLLNLIGVLNSDFKVNAVIDLLDNSIISSKWKFSNEDIHLIREWAKELHIHRFLDGDIFSWMNGLNRLFLGFAMEPKSYELVQATIPYDKLHSAEAVELLAKLSSFIDQLKRFSRLTSSSLSVSEWLSKTKSIAGTLLLQNYDEEFNIQSLIQKLETLKEKVSVSDFNEPILFETFFLWLKDQCSGSSSSSTGFGHGIVVSDYVPNRAIPYKFVGVLGFNESQFPKNVIRPDFDLIHKYPNAGDRISIDEDRNLFFDMIRSAQEKLHFSFIGQDQYTQNKKAPSILLQQLIDVVKTKGIDLQIKEHKLHGFDAVYYTSEEFKSFSKKRLKLVQNIDNEIKKRLSFLTSEISQKKEDDFSEISVNDLISFYSHPSKYVSNVVFGIRDTNDFQDLEDREPFNLSGLEAYFLKDFLVDAYLQGKEVNEVKEISNAIGLLPEGYPGILELDQNKQIVEQFKEVRDRYDFTSSETVDINYDHEGTFLFGTIGSVLDKERVVLRLGDIKGKSLINLWINHLVLNYENEISSSIYFIKKKKSVERFTIVPDSKDISHLNFLIEFYKEQVALKELNFFSVETSFAYAESILNGEETEKAVSRALSKWDGGKYATSECDDFYNQLILKNADFIYSSSFQEAALKIWTPIINLFRES